MRAHPPCRESSSVPFSSWWLGFCSQSSVKGAAQSCQVQGGSQVGLAGPPHCHSGRPPSWNTLLLCVTLQHLLCPVLGSLFPQPQPWHPRALILPSLSLSPTLTGQHCPGLRRPHSLIYPSPRDQVTVMPPRERETGWKWFRNVPRVIPLCKQRWDPGWSCPKAHVPTCFHTPSCVSSHKDPKCPVLKSHLRGETSNLPLV